MAWPSFLGAFLYPPPPSAVLAATALLPALSLAMGGASEIRGEHIPYSKFWAVEAAKERRRPAAAIPSRTGMVLMYSPALAGAVAALFIPGALHGQRATLVAGALAVHFFKRCVEALFLHRYSGSVNVDAAITISSSYLLNTAMIIYTQYLCSGLPEPAVDTKLAGAVLFAVGICGNLYHHWLLSGLRKGGETGYRRPSGGLFGLVVCPHYLFEIIGFAGVAMMAQTAYAVSYAVGCLLYLGGRSVATRRWYRAKFDDFPAGVKCLIPFVF